MTLPELLISITVIGLIVTVLSSAIIVTMGQHDNTEGRLNVARAEQSVSLWVPADLSSADTVDTTPQATPCGLSVCDGIDLSAGSNVLMLSWSTEVGGGTVTTNVSYNFALADDGQSWELTRIQCTSDGGGWTCASFVVLHNLPGPPGGQTFVPGVANGDACTRDVAPVACTRPTWVIIVSEPLAADATDETQLASESERKDANRVIVSINGGGDADGAGGGLNQISITAGGTSRSTIDASSTQGTPSFIEAISRCGGPVSLIVDESTSIVQDGADGNVRASVRAFVETLAGTPVKIQVVEFDNKSSVLGGNDTTQWHRYFDMTNDSEVNTLLSLVNGMSFGGYTNWEDGLFRTFYKADGSIASIVPETVVFFTDGVPNRDRLAERAGPSVLPAAPAPQLSPPWPAQGTGYSQTAYNRAEYIAKDFRVAPSIDLIGVGVGGINGSSEWMADPGAGYAYEWERGYRRYQQGGVGIYESNLDIEKASSFQSNTDYEMRSGRWWGGSSWSNIDPEDYYPNAGSSNYRINGTRSTYTISESVYDTYHAQPTSNFWVSGWTNTTVADYYANQPTRPDKYRINAASVAWYPVSQTLYDTYKSLSPANWRTSTAGVWVSKQTYDRYNTTPDSSDGWIDTGSNSWVTNTADALDWATVAAPSGGNPSSPPGGYRTRKVYPGSPPAGGYAGFDAPVKFNRSNAVILANLIAGNDTGVPAYPTGGPYVNIDEANMYVLPNWNQLVGAMKSVALGECGGTLTLQTKIGGTTPAPDSFIYQRTEVLDAADVPLEVQQTTVTTNQQFTTGTFDMTIPDGQYVTVEIRPQNYDQLTSYTPGSWSCKAGITPRSVETFALGVGAWQGIRVQVAANEAVSCTLSVST